MFMDVFTRVVHVFSINTNAQNSFEIRQDVDEHLVHHALQHLRGQRSAKFGKGWLCSTTHPGQTGHLHIHEK
jgi:hypothetical protein